MSVFRLGDLTFLDSSLYTDKSVSGIKQPLTFMHARLVLKTDLEILNGPHIVFLIHPFITNIFIKPGRGFCK